MFRYTDVSKDEQLGYTNLGFIRTKIFISYCHRDKRHFERLSIHLKPALRSGLIDPWSDTKIKVGEKWREEIENAIFVARIAVLLISADFLASDFINSDELPGILHKNKTKGLKIICVILSASDFRDSQLGEFQTINPPDKPVCKMRPPDREDIWQMVANEVKKPV